ncbi:Mu transposase C-terminal domain-containing protein [Arsenophonus sp. PmNCSU2021_1]|uniref:Mu transposase C-terminal domain-containing protein n=1 Tax=Arsenophonus sp. PmNCSU2021_1 TaxID=3118989 RepID=UPI002FF34648
MFVVAKELIGVMGLPKTTKGIREILARLTKNTPDLVRKRPGTKAYEYHIDCLPAEAQCAIRERHLQQLMIAAPVDAAAKQPTVSKVSTDPEKLGKLEVYRRCPALLGNKLADLTDKQRQIADARMLLVQHILTIGQQPRYSCAQAIRFIVQQAKTGQLPESIAQAAQVANAKKGKSRQLSEITLKRWLADYRKATTPAERLIVLAPGKREVVKPEQIAWLHDYLAHYRKPNGCSMKEAYVDFCAEWQQRYADEPLMLAAQPSYDAVLYAMDKLPEIVKQRGRKTGSEYRQLEGFVRRDWSSLPVNYVWIGDGHGMKMKVAHPDHGQPFSPEVTFILDGSCRYITGWSLSLSENVIAVTDALRYGIATHGKPFLYYSDNGSGETNLTLDADVTGILRRLEIDHPTGIAGNPQGRGIIERLNRTLPMYIARRFATYYGTGADRETVRKTGKALKSALNAQAKGHALTVAQQSTLRKLPSWERLIDEIKAGVEWYNARPHSELPKRPDGQHYSPAEFRRWKLENEATELEWLTQFELRDLFMPQTERTVRRCEIRFLNNIYYAAKLADEHDRKVLVSYDIHDGSKVIVRRMDGTYLCEALWDGNKQLAFPVTAEYHNRQQRIKGMRKRGEEKVALAEAENTLTLPGEKVNDLELPVNVYRQLGNTALKAEVEEQSDLDTEAALQRGLALLEAQQIDPLL